uniref:Inter-alpha-trypsin inhibitor heavy chain 3 n=1 Tax=Tetraodon nigroviridis TaxID=99883 RepID=H3D0L9_TETNG
MLEKSRRKRKPRNSMKRLFLQEEQQDWSSKMASGRKMEKFSVSVNIASNSKVTFVLTYEELLQRTLGQYEILTRVKPKEPVQEFKIVTNIYEPQGLSYVDAQATF